MSREPRKQASARRRKPSAAQRTQVKLPVAPRTAWRLIAGSLGVLGLAAFGTWAIAARVPEKTLLAVATTGSEAGFVVRQVEITGAVNQPRLSIYRELLEGGSDAMLLTDLPAMRAHAGEAVTMLKLLGNEDRLMLLCQLTEGERTVGELEQLTGIGQPTLSQQLGVLRRDGLVQTRREGKFIWYQLADDRALQLMQAIHRLFCKQGA